MTRVLITPALPYANGPFHLGHLLEHVQVNIYTRARRMLGDEVLNVCGSDAHGTPIELNAAKAGVTPEKFVEQWRVQHRDALKNFFIEYDGGFGTTHTDENKKHAARIYEALKADGRISVRDVEQLFDPEAKRFLSDRMVRGTCPKCDATDQYGDSCEVCGSTYSPTELKDAKSDVSGATPVLKSAEHFFVDLAAFTDFLKDYTHTPGRVPEGVRNYLDRWFADGLKDWDISRDGPYFGFQIPGTENKYFYVWLDAPIGYISLTERALAHPDVKASGTLEDWWNNDDVEIHHFIGKDIIYFHILFWPAMLKAAGNTLPASVQVHGMLTVNGVKMSKSRGTFILADDFTDLLGPLGAEALRYYYACKLNGGIDDIDLNLEDFAQRTNTDLVNKIVNLLSRTVPMLHRNHEGQVGSLNAEGETLYAEAKEIFARVQENYLAHNTTEVVKDVVRISDIGNKYLQDNMPWKTVKEDPALAQQQLTLALQIGKMCIAGLAPIVPRLAEDAAQMLGVHGGFTFDNATTLLPEGAVLQPYTHLFERLDVKKVLQLVATDGSGKDKAAPKKKASKKKAAPKSPPPPPSEIDFNDFMKVELRAALVKAASDVEGADKLISVTLDVGALGERHVFSGLKPHVAPADLVGKTVAWVANLKPRKMRFGVSEGMILAAGDDVPHPVFVPGAQPGERIT